MNGIDIFNDGIRYLITYAFNNNKPNNLDYYFARIKDFKDFNLDGYSGIGSLLVAATWSGNITNIAYLLKSGVDIDSSYSQSAKALDTAAEFLVSTDVANYLLDHGVNINSCSGYSPHESILETYCAHSNFEMVSKLIQRGANVAYLDDQGASALHWAAAGGDERIIQLLLKSGSQIDLQDKKGVTALMSAIGNHRVYAVKELIAQGARLDLKDKSGLSAKDYALKGKFEIPWATLTKGS